MFNTLICFEYKLILRAADYAAVPILTNIQQFSKRYGTCWRELGVFITTDPFDLAISMRADNNTTG